MVPPRAHNEKLYSYVVTPYKIPSCRYISDFFHRPNINTDTDSFDSAYMYIITIDADYSLIYTDILRDKILN